MYIIKMAKTYTGKHSKRDYNKPSGKMGRT